MQLEWSYEQNFVYFESVCIYIMSVWLFSVWLGFRNVEHGWMDM